MNVTRNFGLVWFAILVMNVAVHARAQQPPSAGMVLWLDASDINADGMMNNPADGTAVGTDGMDPWVSKAGVGIIAIEDTPFNPDFPDTDRHPHLLTSGINGTPAVHFDTFMPGDEDGAESNDALRTVGYAIDVTKPYTAFIVEQYATATNGTYFSTVNPFSGANGDLLRMKNDGTLRTFPGADGGLFSDFGGLHAPGAGIIAMSNQSVAAGGGAPAEVWINGTSVFTFNTTRSMTATHDLTIGQANTPVPTGSSPFVGYEGEIAEMIFYDRVLSAAELNAVGYYLEQKYMLDTAYTPSASVVGDANGDGFVDIFDVNVISAQWGTAGPEGDVNGDNVVDIFDVNVVSANWAPPPPPGAGSAVPEPSTVLLALIGAGLVAVRRWRLEWVRK